jgi:hypothetical protein
VLPTAAVMLFGEKERPPLPTVTVWTPEVELEEGLAEAAEEVLAGLLPYWARVKGRRERNAAWVEKCMMDLFG